MGDNKLRAWDQFNAEYIYSDDYEKMSDFWLSVERRIDGGNIVNIEQFTGLKDKNGKEIYAGDIINLINEVEETILAFCEYGIARREVIGSIVDIPSFYFRVPAYDNKKTFPIVNNYMGRHDLELYGVIGNIHENPELNPELN